MLQKKLQNELDFITKQVEENILSYENDSYKFLSYLLAKMYLRTAWKKIAKSYKIRSEDVFQHRIKVAATMQSVPRFVDKLCNLLSLQNAEIGTDVLDYLESDKKNVFRILREESIYISRKGIELADLLQKNKYKNSNNKEEENDEQ